MLIAITNTEINPHKYTDVTGSEHVSQFEEENQSQSLFFNLLL